MVGVHSGHRATSYSTSQTACVDASMCLLVSKNLVMYQTVHTLLRVAHSHSGPSDLSPTPLLPEVGHVRLLNRTLPFASRLMS